MECVVFVWNTRDTEGNGELYDSPGYVRTSERDSGLTRKGTTAPEVATAK